MIEKAVILSDGDTLKTADFQLNRAAMQETVAAPAPENLESAEKQVIQNAMTKFGGNLSMVAKSLNISRPTLYSKLKKYGI